MKDLIRKWERESGLDIYGLGANREKWEHRLTEFTRLVAKECLSEVDRMESLLEDEPDQVTGCSWCGLAIARKFELE